MTPTDRSWRLDLPYETPPLSMNDRQHWRAKRPKTRQVRGDGYLLAMQAKIPRLERFTVELHYVPARHGRRDPENLVATLKPLVDGLIDAGVAPDDCPPFYVPTMPVIDEPASDRRPHLFAVVVELDAT